MTLSVAQGRLKGLEPVAVIDIGSNSVRMVIYEGIVRAPTIFFNEKILSGLGKGLAQTGLTQGSKPLRRTRKHRRRAKAPDPLALRRRDHGEPSRFGTLLGCGSACAAQPSHLLRP
jgi:hypothetical protein